MRRASSPWTWHDRIRDPRFAALLALAVAGALLAGTIFGDTGWNLVIGLVLVAVVAASLGLLLLPRWRDPSHGPRAGALVLGVAAAVAIAITIAIR